jgi:hypothetical protein
MDIHVLKNFCSGETEEFYYMLDCCKRIEKELGSDLSLDEAIALYSTLKSSSLICRDGFIINDDLSKDLFKTLGNKGAAAIAASLYNNGEITPDWFWNNYGRYRDEHLPISILPKLIASGEVKLN